MILTSRLSSKVVSGRGRFDKKMEEDKEEEEEEEEREEEEKEKEEEEKEEEMKKTQRKKNTTAYGLCMRVTRL